MGKKPFLFINFENWHKASSFYPKLCDCNKNLLCSIFFMFGRGDNIVWLVSRTDSKLQTSSNDCSDVKTAEHAPLKGPLTSPHDSVRMSAPENKLCRNCIERTVHITEPLEAPCLFVYLIESSFTASWRTFHKSDKSSTLARRKRLEPRGRPGHPHWPYF